MEMNLKMMADKCCMEPVEGLMVAEQANEDILVGRVFSICGIRVVVQLFAGSLNGPWTPILHGSGDPLLRRVSKKRVCENMVFTLT